MKINEEIGKWRNKRVLVIGEALIDKYILGHADSISPDAPVPNITLEKTESYLGGIGLVIQFIKALGGIPELCTIVGDDFEGNFFVKRLKELKIDNNGVHFDKSINTPQITRIRAMNQQLLRLETNYDRIISENSIKALFNTIGSMPKDLGSIVILDFGIGGLFTDPFIQNLLDTIKLHFPHAPIIVRPNLANYYLYENTDLIKITIQKALKVLSIDCCNDTSVSIVGKKVLSTTKCKSVLLNDIESNSFLFTKNVEKVEKLPSMLKIPVRSYVSVNSTIMAVLGLSYAAKTPVAMSVKMALCAASLSASLPPVEFFTPEKLSAYLSEYIN